MKNHNKMVAKHVGQNYINALIRIIKHVLNMYYTYKRSVLQ